MEVYWYFRLVKRTAHIPDLYHKLYPKTADLLEVLGLEHDEIRNYVLNEGLGGPPEPFGGEMDILFGLIVIVLIAVSFAFIAMCDKV